MLHCRMFDWVLNTPQPHFSTPLTPTMLAHRPFYPRWCTNHVTHAGTSPQHAAHVTHASTSPTLVRHPRQHTTNENRPPTLARLPRNHATDNTHDGTNSTPFLKLKAFRSEIPKGNLAAFTFYFTTFTLKLKFFRGNQSALFKRRLFFQKQMPNFFGKNCFLILVSL